MRLPENQAFLSQKSHRFRLFQIWNEDLSYLAQLWATGCRWGHGQPDHNLTYTSLGQNLYFVTGQPVLNATHAIIRWYEEKPYYVFENLTCLKSPCGHYTQVGVCASVRLGHLLCETLDQHRDWRKQRGHQVFWCCVFLPFYKTLGTKTAKDGKFQT